TRCYRDWSSDVCSSDLDFFDRNIEVISQAVFDVLNHTALILESPGFANHQSHAQGADDHAAQTKFQRPISKSQEFAVTESVAPRSEERRVGTECRTREE